MKLKNFRKFLKFTATFLSVFLFLSCNNVFAPNVEKENQDVTDVCLEVTPTVPRSAFPKFSINNLKNFKYTISQTVGLIQMAESDGAFNGTTGKIEFKISIKGLIASNYKVYMYDSTKTHKLCQADISVTPKLGTSSYEVNAGFTQCNESGTPGGMLDLSIEKINNYIIEFASIKDANNYEVTNLTKTASSDTQNATLSGNISKGIYTVTILVKDSVGNYVYGRTETVNIWPGMTTDTWFSADGTQSNPLILNENDFRTTFYVCGSGTKQFYKTGAIGSVQASDTNDGSIMKPLASLGGAVEKCSSSSVDYTIYVDGTTSLTGNRTGFGANITIKGLGDAVTSASVSKPTTITLENATLNKVNFENISLSVESTATKGVSLTSTSEVGFKNCFFNAKNQNQILADCAVTGSKVNLAGFVCSNSTAKSMIKIADNVSGIAQGSVNVTDDLDATSKIILEYNLPLCVNNIQPYNAVNFSAETNAQDNIKCFELTYNGLERKTSGSSASDVYGKLSEAKGTLKGNAGELQVSDGSGGFTYGKFKALYADLNKIYVSSETGDAPNGIPAGNDTQNGGSLEFPLATIQKALDVLSQDKATSIINCDDDNLFSIYLMTDITDSSTSAYTQNHNSLLSVPGGMYLMLDAYNKTGSAGKTINANRNATNTGRVIYNEGILSLGKITILGGNIAGNGSGIYNDGTLKIGSSVQIGTAGDTNDVYLTSGNFITVTGALAGGINTTLATTTAGTVVVEPGTGYTLTDADLTKFHALPETLNMEVAFGTGANAGKGVLKAKAQQQGGGIVIDDYQDYTVTITGIPSPSIQRGNSFTVSVTATDSQGNAVPSGNITDLNVKLMNTSIEVASSSNGTINILASYPVETYQVVVQCKINGVLFSKTFNVTVTE